MCKQMVPISNSFGKTLGYRDASTAEFLGEVEEFSLLKRVSTHTQLYRFPDDGYCLRIVKEDFNTFEEGLVWQAVTAKEAAHWFVVNSVKLGEIPACLGGIVEAQLMGTAENALPSDRRIESGLEASDNSEQCRVADDTKAGDRNGTRTSASE